MTEETSSMLPLPTRLWFAWVCLFRVLFDGLFAARAWSAQGSPALPERAPTPAPAPRQTSAPHDEPQRALQLLSLLQREGRLVDFLQQDIASFADADVGAAARVVHDGCRKALRAHATIEPVRSEAEGSRVVLNEGYPADEVKLTGGVSGRPPYSGVLRHRGWRARRLELPEIVGEHDLHVLAPAEVELP